MTIYNNAESFLNNAQLITRHDGRAPNISSSNFNSSEFLLYFNPVENMKYYEWFALANIDNLTEKYELIGVQSQIEEMVLTEYATAFAFVANEVPPEPIFQNWNEVDIIYSESQNNLYFQCTFQEILDYNYIGIGMYYDWLTTGRVGLPSYTVDDPRVEFEVTEVTMVDNPLADIPDIEYQIVLYRAPFDGGDWEEVETIKTDDYGEFEITDDMVTDETDYCYLAVEERITGEYSNIKCTVDFGYDYVEVFLDKAIRAFGEEVYIKGHTETEGEFGGETFYYVLERRKKDETPEENNDKDKDKENDNGVWEEVGVFEYPGLQGEFVLVDYEADEETEYCYRVMEDSFLTNWSNEVCVDELGLGYEDIDVELVDLFRGYDDIIYIEGKMIPEGEYGGEVLEYQLERKEKDSEEWEVVDNIEFDGMIESFFLYDEPGAGDYCYRFKETTFETDYTDSKCLGDIEIFLKDAVRGLDNYVTLHAKMEPNTEYAGGSLEYRLQRRYESKSNWEDIKTFSKSGLQTEFLIVDDDARPNEDYCYRLKEMKYDTEWSDTLCIDAPTWPELMFCVYIPVVWDLYVDDVELTTEIMQSMYDIEENEVDFNKAKQYGVSLSEDDIDWYEVNQHIDEVDPAELLTEELMEVCMGVWEEDIPEVPYEIFEYATADFWSTVPHFIPKQSFVGIGFNFDLSFSYESNIEVHVSGLENEEKTPGLLGIGFNYWPVLESKDKY